MPNPDDLRTAVRRGDAARSRVLRAALEVLHDDGLPGFTMESVARRAGASKATLYRRWSGTGPLLVDAMDTTFAPLEVPDTGDVARDLHRLLLAFVGVLADSPFPRLLASFIDAAERDPDLTALHADLTRRRQETVVTILDRARRRGELAGDFDPVLITELLTAPLFYRRFVAHRPLPPAYVDAVIGTVLAPLRATPARAGSDGDHPGPGRR